MARLRRCREGRGHESSAPRVAWHSDQSDALLFGPPQCGGNPIRATGPPARLGRAGECLREWVVAIYGLVRVQAVGVPPCVRGVTLRP